MSTPPKHLALSLHTVYMHYRWKLENCQAIKSENKIFSLFGVDMNMQYQWN